MKIKLSIKKKSKVWQQKYLIINGIYLIKKINKLNSKMDYPLQHLSNTTTIFTDTSYYNIEDHVKLLQ